MTIKPVFIRENRTPIFLDVCVEVQDTKYEKFLKITFLALAMLALIASIALMITMSNNILNK